MSKQSGDWPEGFVYTTTSFSADLHPMILKNLLSVSEADEEHIIPLIDKKKIHPNVEIKKIGCPHPLAGQRGLFAKKSIAQNTDLGEYVGQIRLIDARWPLDPVECDFAWTLKMERFFFIIDAKKWANELAFVNDYRGIALEPNVAPKWVVHRGTYHLIFRTIVSIEPGQELLIDYGPDYWSAPHRSWDKLKCSIE